MRTHLEGDPAQIETAAAYLRDAVARGSTDLADASTSQRQHLAVAWQGEAGAAFSHQAALLITAADRLSDLTHRTATEIDALAGALRTAQNALLALRWRAIAEGLDVTDTEILPPLLSDPGGPTTPGASAWEKTEIYKELKVAHEAAMTEWEQALHSCAGSLRQQASALTDLGVPLLSSAYTGSLLVLNANIMRKQAQWLASESHRLTARANDYARLGREGRLRFTYGEYDTLMGHAGAANQAGTALEKTPRPPKLSGFTTSLGVLTSAYGVYADVESGESPTQAVASQGAGLLASVGTMAAVGSAAGPIGTAAGAVAALAAGIAADKAVDQVFKAAGPQVNSPRHGSLGHRALPPDEARISVLLGGTGEVPPSAGPAVPYR